MKVPMDEEKARLDQIAGDSWYAQGANAASIEYSSRIFRRFWRGERCLELGPAEGLMTERLASAFPQLTVVDAADAFCSDLRLRFPKAEVICSLFERFVPSGKYDTIVLGHVLEHVEQPRELLRSVRQWLAPGGVVCSAVPNARSLHRQAAILLGMLESEDSLNPRDLHHGHRRVYNPESFRAEFLAAGLQIDFFGGYWLKPISNVQIEAAWTPEMLEAFMQLGERYPDIAAEICVIASIPEPPLAGPVSQE